MFKRSAILAVLTVSALLCASGRCGAERVKLIFDEREWETAYDVESADQGMAEFVVKGETADAWTELVTLQAFFGLQETATPESYMNGMVASLKQACPSAKANLLRKGEKDIVFDWEIAACPGQENQYEVNRVMTGAKALYVLHYATRKLPVSAETRDKWAGLLSAASLID